MTRMTRRALMGGLALLPLAGCAVPPEPPVFEPLDCAARADGPFTVPAVPIDEVPAGLRRTLAGSARLVARRRKRLVGPA